VVLAGGLSHERDVSLRSGRRVAEALRETGTEVSVSDVDAGLLALLRDDRPDCVVPLLHGAIGEDGAVREVLELVGLPYVGSRPSACRAAFDKPVAKAAAARAGLNTPVGVALPHETFRELGAAAMMDDEDCEVRATLAALGAFELGATLLSQTESPQDRAARWEHYAGEDSATSMPQAPRGTDTLQQRGIEGDNGATGRFRAPVGEPVTSPVGM